MNRLSRALLLAVPVAVSALWGASDAAACGGCFGPPTETTVVTGHRMVLSIAPSQTTLWDQISYSGSPSSWAWVLPIKGLATVGLSSDALFGNLDAFTSVTVQSPDLECLYSGGGGAGGGSGGSDGGGVSVIAQSVVGPYETVQLSATDPAALTSWLTGHGYNIPADIEPIISAYVGESFDFLALKLVPGKGVNAMRPVRVTTPGASPVLPLRMVAAGSGTTTPITLWILGEGRYQPTNLPTFQVDPSLIVWNWDTGSSNYAQLVDLFFKSLEHKGWLTEAGEPFSASSFDYTMNDLLDYDPLDSGYGDAEGNGAAAELADDLDALYGKIPPASLTVTRLRGELSRAALGADLQLGASPEQGVVTRYFIAAQATGAAPCSDGDGGAGGSGGDGTSGGSSGHGCSASSSGSSSGALLLGLCAAFFLARRRR